MGLVRMLRLATPAAAELGLSGKACSSSTGPLRTGTPPPCLGPSKNGDGALLCPLFCVPLSLLSLLCVCVWVHMRFVDRTFWII